jgi:prepilin-type processing-associated H-X9-DG protein
LFLKSGLLGLLVAAVVVSVPFGGEQSTAAQPATQPVRADAPLPTELTFVPHDAALFLYADAAALWTSDLAKTFRAAEKNLAAKFEDAAAKLFGAKIDDLKSVGLFFPKVKGPEDTERFGVIVRFAKAYDKKKLEEGFAALLPKNAKVKVATPSDTVAVVLIGLGEEYAKPQPADADGHLAPALKAAASGKHTLVAGVTLGSLPDELQKDDLPGQVRVFQPILKSQAVIATLDLGKSLTVNVRVKTKREAQALDAEKALAAFAKLISEEGTRELPDLEKDAMKDAGLKDLVTVIKAGLMAAKNAKFEVDGTEARATATLPLDGLPLATAYAAAVLRAQAAAANIESANNLKQIAISLHNYHDSIGNFPPAAVCDKKGKPQLSWRVLILPYIEQDALYKEFKLDEPWDSDNNKKLIAKMPKTYAMPGKTKPGDTTTYYRVFVGNGAGWDWLMGGKITGITDGTSNTLMVVTAAEAVTWTKPDELEFDPDKDMAKLIGMVVNGKAQVAMFDGSVRTLGKLPSKQTLNALITKNGGEVIGDDF